MFLGVPFVEGVNCTRPWWNEADWRIKGPQLVIGACCMKLGDDARMNTLSSANKMYPRRSRSVGRLALWFLLTCPSALSMTAYSSWSISAGLFASDKRQGY